LFAASVHYQSFSILFYSVAVPAFGVLGLLSAIIFAPIFWLIARMGPKAEEFARRGAERAEK